MNKKNLLKWCAYGLAGLTLGGALVYYNFIDKVAEPGAEIGSRCPDFAVDTFTVENGQFLEGATDFVLSGNRDKLCVINFWATWCGGCIAELPYFNEFANKYPEVEMIAIAGLSGSIETVGNWLNNDEKCADWNEFSFTFGLYDQGDVDVFTLLGGVATWPMTVIVDEKGIVVERFEEVHSLEELEEKILPFME